MIKSLEIKTSTLFNLFFVDNTILSSFFLFIDLYVLFPAVITEIVNPTTELATPVGIITNEAKVETETEPVNVENKISEVSNLICVSFL